MYIHCTANLHKLYKVHAEVHTLQLTLKIHCKCYISTFNLPTHYLYTIHTLNNYYVCTSCTLYVNYLYDVHKLHMPYGCFFHTLKGVLVHKLCIPVLQKPRNAGIWNSSKLRYVQTI